MKKNRNSIFIKVQTAKLKFFMSQDTFPVELTFIHEVLARFIFKKCLKKILILIDKFVSYLIKN